MNDQYVWMLQLPPGGSSVEALQNCFGPLTLRQCNGGWASSATALLPPGGEW